ncbi:hypothetical protein [Phaffia rhodozyma]|uniref:Uncharacterized protein n=1 Tax=Phaffia rhodozyma TaxID=264483 RepID=A0A0F7SMA1_PHARH|nr:hypothetical protein [Phaffia rhodozyma]
MSTSQIGAHAEYIKGATVEAIGSLTGSKEWTESGADTKEHAIGDMRSAASSSPHGEPHSSTIGSIEKKAGELVGCEGMVDEGQRATATTGDDAVAAPHSVAGETTVPGTSTLTNEAFDHSKQV